MTRFNIHEKNNVKKKKLVWMENWEFKKNNER